jgi:patatin-like phospholipase/acyl hydrolase
VKLLCLDGGGVRGVLQARVLDRLEQTHPFLAKVDRFAGTSVGAINAMWLSMGRPMSELVELYTKAAPYIFGKNSSLGFFAKNALRGQLVKHLGDARLRDLKRPVLAGAMCASGAKFFDPFDPKDRGELVVDVILAATAAVPALPPHKGFVDGGVLANDPSAPALKWVGAGADTWLLSVGTGEGPPKPRPGLLQQVINAADVGQRVVTESACRQALGDRYCRVQPRLARTIRLDEAEALPELLEEARVAKLDDAVAWLRRAF